MRVLRALTGCLLLCSAAPLAGQSGPPPPPRDGWEAEASTLAVNALLGGVAAGTVRAVQGGSFREGFVRGAAGGALVYAGKRVAVERWSGAGLAGRELAAVGTSVVRNAAEGRAALERVVLPVWIGRVYVTTGPRISVQPRLDLAAAASTLYQALQSTSEFDLGRTVSAGAPVFRVYRDDREWIGFHRAGVILLGYGTDYRGIEEQMGEDLREPLERSHAHERVHVVQFDQAFLLVTAPVEDWLMDRSSVTARLHRWVDPGVAIAPLYLPEMLIPYHSRPWEREAKFLARQPR